MRRRRRWTQDELARRAGIGRMVVGRAEGGIGRLDLDALERIAAALGVPVTIGLGRDPLDQVADAAHLEMQEIVLRLARASGLSADFELPTRPHEPWRSIDVGLASVKQRVVIDGECWNTFGDVGAAARASTRKTAELEQAAVARWGAEGRAALVWIVRESARNRALVNRYPEIFGSRFPGSSVAWVTALTAGGDVPSEAGLVWCDVATGRLHAWRRRA